MRRRKARRRFKSRSILYISVIAALNLIGFGYAMWEDNLNVNFSLSTGNANANFMGEPIISGYGEIYTYLSEDKKTLFIDGEYYPSSIIDISISVEDSGTVPVVLNNKNNFSALSLDTSISTLQELSDKEFIVSIQSNRGATQLYMYEIQEPADDIQITPVISLNDEKYSEYQNSRYIDNILLYEAKIQSLESSIRETQERVSKLEELLNEAENFEEQHWFKHTINYIQIH